MREGSCKVGCLVAVISRSSFFRGGRGEDAFSIEGDGDEYFRRLQVNGERGKGHKVKDCGDGNMKMGESAGKGHKFCREEGELEQSQMEV